MGLTAAELVTHMAEKVLIDIRRVEEWQLTGVIAGAHRLTFFDAAGNSDPADWLAKLSNLAQPEDDLVLICHSGHRSEKILKFLYSRTPYCSAKQLTGGMHAWLTAGLPVERVSD